MRTCSYLKHDAKLGKLQKKLILYSYSEVVRGLEGIQMTYVVRYVHILLGGYCLASQDMEYDRICISGTNI
jgi:hypothetical protein